MGSGPSGGRAGRRGRGRADGRGRPPGRGAVGPPGQGGPAGRGRPGRAHGRPGRAARGAGEGRVLRRAALLGGHDRRRRRRPHAAGGGAQRPGGDGADLLRPRVGGAARRAGRGAAGRPPPRVLPSSPRHPQALPRAPPVRARGADPHREGRHRLDGLDPAVRGADLVSRRRAGRPAGDAGGGPVPAARPFPRGAKDVGRGGHGRAGSRAAHPGLHLQHPPAGQGGRRPPPPLPALADEPQPVQRGQRRVGGGAGGRRARPLRPSPALVPGEGPPARARPGGRLRPPGLGGRGGARRPLERGQRGGARLLRLLLGPAGGRGPPLPGRGLGRRTGAARQAPGGLLRLHGPVRASVRAAQLHVAAVRRAHPGP